MIRAVTGFGRFVRRNFFSIVALTLLADLGSKAWALRALAHAPHEAIPGRLSFVLAHNQSGAMGFLRQLGPEPRRALLVAVSMLAAVAITTFAARTRPEERALRTALALILGGALGNVIDRVLRGAVVDFIDIVYAPGRHWHTFNVADVAIVVGAIVLAVAARPPSARAATT